LGVSAKVAKSRLSSGDNLAIEKPNHSPIPKVGAGLESRGRRRGLDAILTSLSDRFYFGKEC
jgi:hypothetical protein